MRVLLLTFIFSLSLLASDAQTAAEFYTKGTTLKQEKKINEAITALKEAIRLDPNHKDAMYELGWCYNDTKDYTGALSVLRKARNLGLATARLYFETGYAFDKLNMLDSAIASYNQCLSINSTYSLAHKQLGFIAYTKEDYTKAIEHFSKYETYTKTPPTDYLYWYRKGFTHNALKNYEEARKSLYNSLAAKKDYINTYLEIGFASTKLKLNDSAIYYYKKAMELDPKSHIPYNGIGEVYRDNIKDRNEAMNWYKKALAININERKANFGMGYCLNSLGKYSEATAHLKKAIEQEPTYTAAYVELGYSYYMTGSNTLALENLNKAISLNPANENARYYSGLVYINQGNKAQAQKMVDELKSLNSKNTASLQEKVSKM